jgi:hypothetical protein
MGKIARLELRDTLENSAVVFRELSRAGVLAEIMI